MLIATISFKGSFLAGDNGASSQIKQLHLKIFFAWCAGSLDGDDHWLFRCRLSRRAAFTLVDTNLANFERFRFIFGLPHRLFGFL